MSRTFEIAGGVWVHDIVRDLPRDSSREFRAMERPPKILVVHHAGVDNRKDGVEAFAQMARYHVNNKGWRGIAYHYGIPYRQGDEIENLIMYRTGQPRTIRTHTRGLNVKAEAVVLQGHLGNTDLSDSQVECLEAFLPWWLEQHPGGRISWHADAWRHGGIPKPWCPGKHAVAWLRAYRRGMV